MEQRPPQFVKMNAEREEDPPRRDVGCVDYKACLSLAARRNLCLDCSLCEAGAPEAARAVRHAPRSTNSRRDAVCAVR